VEYLISSDYDHGTTSASFELLKNFLELMNKKNIQTVVIGGWATEAFYDGIGSKDIDVVMVNDADIQKLLSEKFFDDKGIDQTVQIPPLRYKKQITIDGKSRTIICDIFSAEYQREDYEDLGIKIHWGLTHQFKEPHKIRGIPTFVPKRELLIILKIIAAVDRSARLDMKGGDDDENLQSKIWKDYRDIAVLTAGQKLDKEFLKKYITESHLLIYLEKFLSRYRQPENEEVLHGLGMTPKEIENALKF
jgi:hypothetical protein